MDAGWAYGLRPSGAQDERHIQAHLNDMRDIARHVLKMDKTPPNARKPASLDG